MLLALGIGVLIGRSGEQTASTPTQAAPIVIHSGGGEAAKEGSSAKTNIGGNAANNSKAKKKSVAAIKKEAESGAAAEAVLKPAAGVKLPPPTAQPGDPCESGTAGCEHGKQTGNYFGP